MSDIEIEEQLAFGQAAKIDQQQINALVAEEAELRALVLEDLMKIAAESVAIGRKLERADVVALMRRKARDDGDEDFATTTSVWADVLEDGAHEGEAERETEADAAALRAQAEASAPDPNQLKIGDAW